MDKQEGQEQQQQQQQQGQQQQQQGQQQEEWRNVDEVKKIISQRDEFKNKAREYESRLSQLENEAKERQAKDEAARQSAEQDRLKNEGKYREALELSEKKWKSQQDEFRGRVANRLVPLAIQSAAGKLNNLTPEAISDLPSLLERHLSIDPESLEVYPVGQDGKRMVDDRLQPVTVENFVQGFVSSRPYLLKDSLPQSHGANGGSTKRTEKIDMVALMSDPKAMAQMEKDDPEGYKEAMKEWNKPANLKELARQSVLQKAAFRTGTGK